MQSVRFDRAVGYYDATRGFAPGTAERIRDAIIAELGVTQDTRLLEIGVGTGRIALPFLAAGHRYIGVDLSRPMLQVLQSKLPEHKRPQLVEGDATQLPFAAASFDIVIGVHVLHLVADWRATLHEARRVLRRRGSTLLIAGDSGPSDGADLADLPPPAQAQRIWATILNELGYPVSRGRPGIRTDDPAVRATLEGLGATVREIDLAEYERRPLSARMAVQAFRDRIYSSDWSRPDEIHAAALTRMDQWLASSCPDPDRLYSPRGQFRALLAHWA